MKIRRGAVAVSSILFTLALLVPTPIMMNWALVTHQSRFRDISSYPEPGIARDQVVIPNYYAPVGITSLAIIAIGLVVAWAGYIRGVRWTWFVMFVIVWVWAFPVGMLPFFYPWRSKVSIAQTMANALADAISGNGVAREFVGAVLVFLLMVVALLLPAKTFLLGRRVGESVKGTAHE